MVTGISEDKVIAVRDYLKHEFPDHEVHDKFDSNMQSHSFYLPGENKTFSVRRAFFQDHSVPQVLSLLEISEPGKQLSKEGVTHIIMENDGTITTLKDTKIRSSR